VLINYYFLGYDIDASDEGGEEELLWLQRSAEPWATVERNWSLTTHSRKKFLIKKPYDSTYLATFPALSRPDATKLVSQLVESKY